MRFGAAGGVSITVLFVATGLMAPSWGLEVTSYLYIAFIVALSLSTTSSAVRPRGSRSGGAPAILRRR